MESFEYPEPIQGGDEPVYRQRGITAEDLQAKELEGALRFLPPIVQPGGDVIVTRQTGIIHESGPSGVMQADHPAGGAVSPMLADMPIGPTHDAGFPGRPGVVPGAPLAAAPPVAGVVSGDDGGSDPRHASGGPQVFSGDALPVIKKAPVVPLVVSDQTASKVKIAGQKG